MVSILSGAGILARAVGMGMAPIARFESIMLDFAKLEIVEV